jgi:hypothetical protein
MRVESHFSKLENADIYDEQCDAEIVKDASCEAGSYLSMCNPPSCPDAKNEQEYCWECDE